MAGTLTGTAATEALRLYAGLGSLGARFDGRKVESAVRSSSGRARLSQAIRHACRASWSTLARTFRHSPSGISRSRCRATRTAAKSRSRCASRAASGDPHPAPLAASPEAPSASPDVEGRG